MDDKLEKDFLIQISKIKNIMVFIGVANLLGVKIQDENGEKPMDAVLIEILEKFSSKPRSKRKELVQILAKANKKGED